MDRTCVIRNIFGETRVSNLLTVVIWKRRFRSEKASYIMFFVHTTLEEFKNATVIDYFVFVYEVNSATDITPLFSKYFRPHENGKQAFSNSFGMKSVFEKFRFRDGLVWTVSLTNSIQFNFYFLLLF